ncbi:MAG: hypothetical protein A2341_01020 [Deltaproteobacteria bacterium RIFOXYB12_FULL_58_9]|nr:MAG: hypothetical protein A2341_01020 [Deltaproteobacteria bacterium RIFOXYB12_FULL_58_9]
MNSFAAKITAQRHLARLGDDVAKWEVGVADNAGLPVPDASADLAIPFDPPTVLARYYAMLGDEFQFSRNWIRTDYKFASMAEGEGLVRFFFGDDRANAFAASGTTILPECTGLWWRKK